MPNRGGQKKKKIKSKKLNPLDLKQIFLTHSQKISAPLNHSFLALKAHIWKKKDLKMTKNSLL